MRSAARDSRPWEGICRVGWRAALAPGKAQGWRQYGGERGEAGARGGALQPAQGLQPEGGVRGRSPQLFQYVLQLFQRVSERQAGVGPLLFHAFYEGCIERGGQLSHADGGIAMGRAAQPGTALRVSRIDDGDGYAFCGQPGDDARFQLAIADDDDPLQQRQRGRALAHACDIGHKSARLQPQFQIAMIPASSARVSQHSCTDFCPPVAQLRTVFRAARRRVGSEMS